MNEFQNKLIEDLINNNPKLINNCIKATRAKPEEDFLDVAYLGLCKAAIRYKPNDETQFTTYAVHVMKNEIFQEMRKNYTYGNKNISLESINDDAPEDRFNLKYDEFEDETVLDLLIDTIRERIGDEKFTILQMIIEGYNKSEIALASGYTQQYISRIHSEIKNIFRNIKKFSCEF